jgi:hypothetical protein
MRRDWDFSWEWCEKTEKRQSSTNQEESPWHTLAWDIQSPELWENGFQLLKLLGLCVLCYSSSYSLIPTLCFILSQKNPFPFREENEWETLAFLLQTAPNCHTHLLVSSRCPSGDEEEPSLPWHTSAHAPSWTSFPNSPTQCYEAG